MDDRERAYLRAAYDIAKTNEMRAFDEHEVAAKLDLDFEEPGWVDRHVAVTNGLIEDGLVESVHKGGGSGRRALRLGRRGMEEGRRLADPATQRRDQRRRLLRAIYDLAGGDPGMLVYWDELAPVLGWSAENADHEEEAHGLALNAEQSGLIKIEADEGGIYRITARGVAAVEGDEPQQMAPGPTFNLYGPVQGSVIGTNNRAELTNTFDSRSIEQRIEREGGQDREELQRALDRVERLIERGEYLDRGALSEFSGAMERHSWFTGAVAQALIGFATQAAG